VLEGIDVHVEAAFRERVDADWIKQVARRVLEEEGEKGATYEASVAIVGSRAIQELNRDYRGIDEPTDVLSFGLLARQEDAAAFVLPPDNVLHMGEVIVSYPQAEGQAREQGHPVKQELAQLVIHGMLHLLGYDHEESEQEGNKMRDREAIIFRAVMSHEEHRRSGQTES
jgi:probable rRNA maturation factor